MRCYYYYYYHCDFQIDLLESGLLLHGRLCSSEVQPLHKRLQERFLQLKSSFRESGGRSIIK